MLTADGKAIQYAISTHYGDVNIVRNMSSGGTDGKEFRTLSIAVYGVSGMVTVSGESNAHGLNEKAQVQSFYHSLTSPCSDFLSQLLCYFGN
jgi:acetylornithine deacetylase/succinyl-diaminopimelate desuccinylase-like protein